MAPNYDACPGCGAEGNRYHHWTCTTEKLAQAITDKESAESQVKACESKLENLRKEYDSYRESARLTADEFVTLRSGFHTVVLERDAALSRLAEAIMLMRHWMPESELKLKGFAVERQEHK